MAHRWVLGLVDLMAHQWGHLMAHSMVCLWGSCLVQSLVTKACRASTGTWTCDALVARPTLGSALVLSGC